MKIFSSKKRVAAIGAITAATLVGGGVAYAYWTAAGSGTGSASTGSDSALTVEFISTDATVVPLKPGNGVQNFDVKVTNPATAGVQRLNKVDVSIAAVDGSGNPVTWNPGVTCSKADYELNSLGGGNAAVLTPPPNTDLLPGGTWTGTLTVKMVNTTSNQNDCRGLAVPLYAAAS